MSRSQVLRNLSVLTLALVLGLLFLEIPAVLEATPCREGSGWTWTIGPVQPEIAARASQGLDEEGIEAVVTVTGSGETDSCGNFRLSAVDFEVALEEDRPAHEFEQQELIKHVTSILRRFAQPNLGRVAITFPSGETVLVDHSSNETIDHVFRESSGTSDATWERKVYVVVYDPLLTNGQLLSDYLNWYDHETLTQATIDFFGQVSGGRLKYSVSATTVITDGWPEKIDGYRYTEEEYLAVVNEGAPPHVPDTVSYNKIVNDPELDICGKANRREIDEVWIYNGPYFGFYESTLVGPGAYWYNSEPVPGPWSCERLVPIMGPSPHVALANAIHNFGHRTESTFTQVYGSWNQNSTDHNWERFALVKALSPDYNYSGCGNVHYPPNATSDYNYNNPSTVSSNCDDFVNYPDLGNPVDTVEPVKCTAWGCTEIGYHTYWFSHLPSNAGCGPDNVANNWWHYFVDPALALDASAPCKSDLFLPVITNGARSASLHLMVAICM